MNVCHIVGECITDQKYVSYPKYIQSCNRGIADDVLVAYYVSVSWNKVH